MAQSTTASSSTRVQSLGEPVVMIPSAARTTVTETASDWFTFPPHEAIEFELDVTAAATDAGDTLDVQIYTKFGANDLPVIHFTQVLGNGGAKKFYAKIMSQTAETLGAKGTLAAGTTVRHILGQRYKATYAVGNTSTDDASFTFSVVGIPV